MQANYVNGAAGTIAPSVFVVQDTTNPLAVNQASGASAFLVGISQSYVITAPVSGASLVAASAQGDPIMVFQIGDVCLLQSTTAGWTQGDFLTATTGGKGLTASGGNYIGAIALTSVSGAALGQVQIVQPGKA